jgi:hypothetical protein
MEKQKVLKEESRAGFRAVSRCPNCDKVIMKPWHKYQQSPMAKKGKVWCCSPKCLEEFMYGTRIFSQYEKPKKKRKRGLSSSKIYGKEALLKFLKEKNEYVTLFDLQKEMGGDSYLANLSKSCLYIYCDELEEEGKVFQKLLPNERFFEGGRYPEFVKKVAHRDIEADSLTPIDLPTEEEIERIKPGMVQSVGEENELDILFDEFKVKVQILLDRQKKEAQKTIGQKIVDLFSK